MFRTQKALVLVLVFALMFAAVPLAMAQGNQPPQPPQPTQQQPPQQPPTTSAVNVNVNIPWGTILLVAVAVLILLALVGLASAGRSNVTTHTVERVEEHHHDDL